MLILKRTKKHLHESDGDESQRVNSESTTDDPVAMEQKNLSDKSANDHVETSKPKREDVETPELPSGEHRTEASTRKPIPDKQIVRRDSVTLLPAPSPNPQIVESTTHTTTMYPSTQPQSREQEPKQFVELLSHEEAAKREEERLMRVLYGRADASAKN